jgi:hypothetical protein
MDKTATKEEILLKISQLEERILNLEHRAQKNSNVVLAGAKRDIQNFYKEKKKELDTRKGGE